MEGLPAQRPGSIRSVASNSSLSSSFSLARRPRTRMRSKTVTGSSQPQDIPHIPLQSDLPYLTGHFVQEPLEDQGISPQSPLTAPPPRPPKSPQRLEAAEEIRISDTTSSLGASVAEGSTYVEPTQSTAISARLGPSKAAKQASSLPHLDTGYRPPPSAFSRDPALTPVVNARDSVSTQQSGVSSSLYPPSTSTASGPASPTSPQSMAAQVDPPPFALEVNEVQDYDSDDVSYRLRLLVKNNYFLPPAHSKPSPADFALSPLAPQKKSPRSTAPTFLDIFRVGKSKSKPTTPTGTGPAFDPMAPMLRTTSESITAAYALNSAQPRSSSQFPHTSPNSPAPPSRGRVVVVREKMLDIATAARQAEQDLKIRGVRIEQGSQNGNAVVVDDFIDPTDAVDIPLPSPSYPFAVQASAMHGLGVLDSVGAGILADLLPPSQNPNLSSSYDPVEDTWRKALLHEAVGHSLDNTLDDSTFSHILGASTPLASPRSKGPGTSIELARNLSQKLLQQKIVDTPMMDDDTPRALGTKHSRQKSGQSQASTSRISTKRNLGIPTSDMLHSSRPSSYLPQRVETPSGPRTPLGPPPRRHITPSFSMSQTDLGGNQQLSQSTSTVRHDESHRSLRRTVSSPSLAEGHESAVSQRVMTPPLPQSRRDSQATFTSFNAVHSNYISTNGTSSEPHESENEEPARRSLALSAMRSRPSLSEYSQESQSPTTSVFQEMLNRDPPTSSSATPEPSRFSVDQQNAFIAHPSARLIAMSPPPRNSSSLAHEALPPPPRSSSHNYHSPYLPSGTLGRSLSQPHHRRRFESADSTFQILAPEPTTPPLPRNHFFTDATILTIPSTPGPSSPTSFFDSIQTQPNAMDDLESSSDEDDEPTPIHPQPKLFVDPRTRAISNAATTHPKPLIMKHGNFSAPYIRGGESYRQNSGPFGEINPKQAISNIPIRPSKTAISASSDFFKYAQENPATHLSASLGAESEFRRPSTSTDDHVTTWRNNQKAQESLRKLDGMLLQHMEDEKDTIKRIATTLKQTANLQSSDLPGRR